MKLNTKQRILKSYTKEIDNINKFRSRKIGHYKIYMLLLIGSLICTYINLESNASTSFYKIQSISYLIFHVSDTFFKNREFVKK